MTLIDFSHAPSVRDARRTRRTSLLHGLLLTACCALMPAAANAADPVKVGSIFDLTGGLNIYGLQQSRALRLAVDDINAQGGLLGRTVEVVQLSLIHI